MPLEDIYNAVLEMKKDAVSDLVRDHLEAGSDVQKILDDGLIAAMTEVGGRFSEGVIFVPEMLLSALAMKNGLEVLRPLLTETGVKPKGKIVVGTVKGDVHDIGKNLVAMMMEGSGYLIADIGVRNSAEDFLAAIDEHKPDMVGLSAMLTTTMPYMKTVIDAMAEAGIRDDVLVLVGGAPLNQEFARKIGADAYCEDAPKAVEAADSLLAGRRQAGAARRAGAG